MPRTKSATKPVRDLKELSTLEEAYRFLDGIRKNKEGRFTIRFVRFPDGMVFDHRWNGVRMADCVMHNATFDRPYYFDLIRCDLTGSEFGSAYFTRGYLHLVDCVLDNTIGWYVSSIDHDLWDHPNGKLARSLPSRCPKKGAYTAYKKCKPTEKDRDKYPYSLSSVIVKLRIPADAQRTSSGGDWNGAKCRASKAKVVSIYGYLKDGTGKKVRLKEARSEHDLDFIYKVGKVVKPIEKFERNRFDTCASGIHHFMTEDEAQKY